MLRHYVSVNNLETAKNLLVDKQISSIDCHNALYDTVKYGYNDMAKFLLSDERFISVAANKHNVCFIKAVERGNLELVKLLASIDTVALNANAQNNKALITAYVTDRRIVKFLLTLPAIINDPLTESAVSYFGS
jgi:hypothetical protein